MVLAPLVLLAVLFFALALAFVLEDMIKNIANVVRGITLVGGYLAGALDAIAQAISNALGIIERGIDGLIGAAWHLFASYLDRTWHQLEAHAALLAHLAELVGNGIYNITGLRGLVHGVLRTVHGIEAGVKSLERDFHGIERQVRTLEHDISKGIGSDVLPRIKSLERGLANVEGRVLPAVEGAETALANDITQLGEYVRANFLSSATDAISAAVVVALSALGLSGLRCNSLLNSLSNRGCGLWQGLEDLLGLLFDAAIFVDLCAIIPEVEVLFGEFEQPLTDLIASAADAACAQPPPGYPTLPTVALSLTANPGFTLSLP